MEIPSTDDPECTTTAPHVHSTDTDTVVSTERTSSETSSVSCFDSKKSISSSASSLLEKDGTIDYGTMISEISNMVKKIDINITAIKSSLIRKGIGLDSEDGDELQLPQVEHRQQRGKSEPPKQKSQQQEQQRQQQPQQLLPQQQQQQQ